MERSRIFMALASAPMGNGYETKVVKKISEGILDGLSMKKMNLIMLSMIGMNGIGGVGKIFVTKAIYNFLSFLTNVREVFLNKI